MTRILRLLLIAAIALPMWQPLAAQDLVPAPDQNLWEEWQFQSDYYVRTANLGNTEAGWALGAFGTNRVTVAIDGSTIYVKGFSKNCPDGWVRGTIDGNTVTFPRNQYLGKGINDNVDYYFWGEYTTNVNSPTVADVIFTYDANIGMLTQQSFDATDTDGSTFKSFYYINESTSNSAQNALVNAVAYHEAVVMMRVKDHAMKTLTAEEISEVEGFTYTYGNNQTGNLLETVEVTDEASAEHAIALMRAVYTNKALPGPKWRGYTTAGAPDTQYPVNYAGVGTINSSHNWANTYGWNISGNVRNDGSSSSTYFLDPTQYEPNEEGYTLLLVEMKDDFKDSDVWGRVGYYQNDWLIDQNNLTEYVRRTIKSVRILTDFKRTGTNVSQGTLFKINANALNRFFFLGKGQLRMFKTNYTYPYTYSTADGQSTVNAYLGPYRRNSYTDDQAWRIFYHMFEEFSPSQPSGGIRKSDIYNELVHQLDDDETVHTGFSVLHDCSSVPYAETDLGRSGHEFKMLPDEDSSAASDVRDLLFFVPDYRMMDHSGRHSGDNLYYINYNQSYAPRMDMYVIHLKPIKGEPVAEAGVEHVYQLEVNWRSNMASFLPATDQTFTLYRSITDAYGTTEFERVYKTNHNGDWLDKDGKVIEVITNTNEETGVVTYTYKVDGQVVDDPRVPIVMEGAFSVNDLDYFDYIKMDPTGKQVTYYVVGQDAGEKDQNGDFILVNNERVHFLDEVESNRESYMIPGYQKNLRLTFRIDSETYSKFDIPSQKNNYWNEIIVANNKGTSVTADFFKAGDDPTKIYFRRIADGSFSSEDPYDKGDLVATATVTSKGNGKITVSMVYNGQESFTGSKIGENKASYEFTYPTSVNEDEAVVEFGDWKFYDNFTADVSQNEHPGMYAYRAYFKAAQPFPLYDFDDEGNPVLEEGYETVEQMLADEDMKSTDVLSNPRLIKIYKTTPTVNTPLTLQNVLNDEHMEAVTVPTEAKLSITAESASIAELWRYEIFRWEDDGTNNVPNNLTVYGHVQNQSGSFSVKFGDETFDVTKQGSTTTVNMEDKALEEEAGAYYYVPQAKVYSSRPALSDGTPDYDTYGAPRVNTAMGKVEVGMPDNAQIPMSSYMWYAKGRWNSYYNILLNFSKLNIPDGYELYKVRAWRKIDPEILCEEYYEETGKHDRNARLEMDANGWYLYEDINYGDQLSDAETDGSFLTMNKTNFASYQIGNRSVSIVKPQNPDATDYPEPLFVDAGENEMRATFGAERMKTADDPDHGARESMPTEFKVRAYFTRSSNPLISQDHHSQLYVVGDMGSGWNFSTPLATLSSNNGSTFMGTLEIPEGGGYILLSKELGRAWANDDKPYLLGADWGDGDAVVDPTWVFRLETRQNDNSKVIKFPAGSYKVTVDDYKESPVESDGWYAGSLTVTRNTTAKAPVLRMTGDNEQYYVAEGEFARTFLAENIITGIETLNSSEVVGVKYYNTLGIESDRPFDGVNIVVTRYSDGSISTTKILK